MNPLQVHLAFEPRGAGLLHAAAWRTHEDHVLGWFIRPAECGAVAGYFMLPCDYAARDAALLRSLSTDVQGDWVEVHRAGERPLDDVPVPLSLRRSLTRLHDVFVRHWLFFERDPDAFLEGRALRALGIPLRHANVRAARFGQFQPMSGVWRYQSPGADSGVPMHLSRHLPRDPDRDASACRRGGAPGASCARVIRHPVPAIAEPVP
ncbi:MAG TPA: hypothetical protein VFZ93_08590 [Albitalea sp.]